MAFSPHTVSRSLLEISVANGLNSYSVRYCTRYQHVSLMNNSNSLILSHTYLGFIFWGGCLAESQSTTHPFNSTLNSSIPLVILVFRTWVIWEENKRIRIGLIIFFVAVVVSLVYLTYLGLTAVECEWRMF